MLALTQKDVDRIGRMLVDYEAGRLFAPDNGWTPPRQAPIETYIGLVQSVIPASDGEPTSGTVAIYGADPTTALMNAESNYIITAYSLWDVEIEICQWVHLALDHYSGFYFVVSIPGTYGCGSGAPPLWYCLASPPESGSGESGESGSGESGESGSGCNCVPYLCLEWAWIDGDGVLNFTGEGTPVTLTQEECGGYFFENEYTGISFDGLDLVINAFDFGPGDGEYQGASGWDCNSPYTVTPIYSNSGFPPSFTLVPGACSGSGSGAWYCLELPNSGESGNGSGAWYCLELPNSGSGDSGSGSGFISDECGDCAEGTLPYCWTTTLSGYSCTQLNGTYTFTYVGECCWQCTVYITIGDSIIKNNLYFGIYGDVDSYGWGLWLGTGCNASNSFLYQGPVGDTFGDFVCDGPNTLTQSQIPPGCTGGAATITISPC